PKRSSASPDPRQEARRARQITDQMPVTSFQRDEIELQLRAPMLEAIPRERARDALLARRELALRGVESEPVPLSVAGRHELAPEEIVEREIEQRAVHVDQHGIDLVPAERWIRGGHARKMVPGPAHERIPSPAGADPVDGK